MKYRIKVLTKFAYNKMISLAEVRALVKDVIDESVVKCSTLQKLTFRFQRRRIAQFFCGRRYQPCCQINTVKFQIKFNCFSRT